LERVDIQAINSLLDIRVIQIQEIFTFQNSALAVTLMVICKLRDGATHMYYTNEQRL